MKTRKKLLSKKAVSEIISFVLIILLSIALVGTAYAWAWPLILKRQHTMKVEKVLNYFDQRNSNSLISKIESVAKTGMQDTFFSDVDGIWILHEYNESGPENNSIEFITFSKVTNVAVGNWSSITFGSNCPPQMGLIGIDSPLVVCGKSDFHMDGFDVVYRGWSRKVINPVETQGYKINLVKAPNGPLQSTGDNIFIKAEKTFTCVPTTPPDPPNPACPTETLIITEVKILLG